MPYFKYKVILKIKLWQYSLVIETNSFIIHKYVCVCGRKYVRKKQFISILLVRELKAVNPLKYD